MAPYVHTIMDVHTIKDVQTIKHVHTIEGVHPIQVIGGHAYMCKACLHPSRLTGSTRMRALHALQAAAFVSPFHLSLRLTQHEAPPRSFLRMF